MSPGDTIRTCKHPELVPHPLPARLPTASTGTTHRIVWRNPKLDRTAIVVWPKLMRCVACGLAGEVCFR